MAEFPALPLWTDAYLADTRHLSTVQHGAYLLLLMEAWRRPHTELPDDDNLLARLAGLSASEWHMHKDVIMAFWKHDGRTKTWHQKRLTDEKAYVVKTSKKQRSNAKSRWNKEKEASHGNTKADAKQEPRASQTDAPTPTPTPTPTPITPPKGGVEERPTDIPEIPAYLDRTKATPPPAPFVWEQALFAVPGVKESGLELSPYAAMVQLHQDGYDLHAEVIPIVKRDLARAQGQSRANRLSWTTIAKRVREAREDAGRIRTNGSKPTIDQGYEAPWDKRLAIARERKQWPAKWGPYPNQPGCLAPAALVLPDDGKGWTDWKVAS